MSQAGVSYIEHVVSLNVGPKTYFSVHFPLFPAWFLIFTKHVIPHLTWQSWARGQGKAFLQIAQLVVADQFLWCSGSFFTQNVAPDIFWHELWFVVFGNYFANDRSLFCKVLLQIFLLQILQIVHLRLPWSIGSISPCLFVHSSRFGVTRPNLHYFQYIQT